MDTTYFRFSPTRLRNWLLLIAIVVALYLTTKVTYLLFHTTVELFSIIIAATVFILTWSSLQYIKNQYLIIVGISYLFIGILDLLHTMSYPGMQIFLDYEYYANQLWIAARYMESITLFVAFWSLPAERRIRASHLFIFYFAVTSLLIASIFYWKTFPICFIKGTGLTPFKIYSEYAICAILAASMFVLARNRRYFSADIYWLILLSIAFAIGSELCFTLYVHNYGLWNMFGHFFKLFSFVMIYRAIVATGIEEPFQLIFSELNQANKALRTEIELRKELEIERERASQSLRESEAALKELNQDLENRVAERTAELHEKDQLLMVQSRQAAMGEMISHIAHQWRQPLNTLALVVQEVPLIYEVGDLNKEYLDRFSKTSLELIQHMSRTVDDFRNFFKPDKEKVPFKVNDIVEKTLSLVKGTFREQRITIEVKASADPTTVGFPNEFSQVLLNILINARDVLAERKVTEPKVVVAVAKEGERTVVTITDNGGGIPEEIIDRIFDPYFSTKGPQAGTGVGLSMSRTIIEKSMGGRVTARNVEGGAEFRIEI